MWLGWDGLQEKVKMKGVLLWEGRWVNESTQIRLWPISPEGNRSAAQATEDMVPGSSKTGLW